MHCCTNVTSVKKNSVCACVVSRCAEVNQDWLDVMIQCVMDGKKTWRMVGEDLPAVARSKGEENVKCF